ncbi:acetyltransferase (GNAT) family protein [Acidovorax sp. 62]|uniref:GNAT family N-acetyltransferase n=1 Tax=Acidovorax sp. 62 TaxID=2035203 RepID=UPI000C18CB4A|nr:GNAT family N-acetyltransferase [Acidovorax sp. 62]PIF91426.1 acetyltransferase (GNAT) family protein [Acidovorax sp. 62]
MATPEILLTPHTDVCRANAAEAAQACDVVRQSITHCCALDHRDDPQVLAAWLANKTAERFAAWMTAPGAMAWGAYRGGDEGARMVGFVLLMQSKLALCYVVPQALHQGVGRALLQAAEDAARQAGVAAVELESTRTAEPFYRRHGYEPAGAVQAWAGLQAQPMRKRL